MSEQAVATFPPAFSPTVATGPAARPAAATKSPPMSMYTTRRDFDHGRCAKAASCCAPGTGDSCRRAEATASRCASCRRMLRENFPLLRSI